MRAKHDSAAEVRQYARHAEQGAAPFELEIVERHVRPGGRLLDVGCDAGREAIGFARAGFSLVAIDLAPGMIEAARENARREGLAIEFRVQSATELADPPGSFDGVFFTGAVYNHIPGRALRIETLRRLGRALTPGGALLLGVAYRRRLGLVSRTRVVDFLRVLSAKVFGPGKFSGITSSDTNATLPANAALVAGTKTFSVTLKTAGTATVAATDITDGTKTANTSPSITVNAAS